MADHSIVDPLELHLNEEKLGLSKVEFCSNEEVETYKALLAEDQELPSDIVYYNQADVDGTEHPVFYHYTSYLDTSEKQEFIQILQLARQEKIHRWICFFGILVVLSLIATFIWGVHFFTTLQRFIN